MVHCYTQLQYILLYAVHISFLHTTIQLYNIYICVCVCVCENGRVCRVVERLYRKRLNWKQDTNDIFLLIIVLYGVNTLVFVLLYEHNVHLNYKL